MENKPVSPKMDQDIPDIIKTVQTLSEVQKKDILTAINNINTDQDNNL